MITAQDLQVIEGKPRVLDLKIAERLEFERPRDIRKLIERNLERLSRRGEVCAIMAQTTDIGGRPGTEFWLTKWQAIKICMWSEAPKADTVQDEIADVFDAYTDGKLVPPNQAPVSNDVLREMYSIRRTVEHTHEVVKGTAGNVVQLKEIAIRTESRINDVIPTKDPSEKNKRMYIYTIAKRGYGYCPCGCRQKILNEMGDVLLDEMGRSVLEYDHFYTRERNGLEAMWPVHRECNIKLRDDDYRQTKLARFQIFQEECKAVKNEVPDKPRKMPDKNGQQEMF